MAWIELDGAVNVRDLGDLPTEDGQKTARARLLRADNLQDLSAADVRKLVHDIGVTTVVDLRSSNELAAEGPAPLDAVAGVRHAHHPVLPEVGSGAGYVYDFGPGEEWWARRGEGAYLNGSALSDPPSERRTPDDKLELLAVESADPRWLAAQASELVEVAHRLRAIGSIAISMCQVACTRVDGMVTLWRARAVDAAAAQLIVRESGGQVAFTAYEDPLAAPLDVRPHSPVVAARTAESLALLRGVPMRD